MTSLFIPSEIPWPSVKGKVLEELLYWLFDAMGAKDLEWRLGGVGAGTADQGRDLELSFYLASPDGELIKQRWWVEAKGRSGTVEPIEVKSAVLNAAGKSTVDVLVIATNAAFSNPTRDWVKEWQASNARPRIKLWEKTELENHCSKNPIAVIRLFSQALSSQGRLEVAKTKLWDYATFTDESTLAALWEDKSNLVFDGRALVALVASEAANGDLSIRSWGMSIEEDILVDSLSNGLINFLYLVFRANNSGVRQEPLIRALAYLTLASTKRLGDQPTSNLLQDLWSSVYGKEYPEQIRSLILEPIVGRLFDEVKDVCTSDCTRVSTDRTSLSEEEVIGYWNRLKIREMKSVEPNHIEPKHVLTVETIAEPCKVGFAVGKDVGCPLCATQELASDICASLSIVNQVVQFRYV
jgi:hypothetical protein